MGKIAFIFAGQGSQYVGMGKEIVNYCEESKKVFQIASEALDLDLLALCENGPKEELDKTENTQPLVLTTSIAILRLIESQGIVPSIVAGLSLGEYSALVCSGVLDFGAAVKLVKKRGKFMQEAVPEGVGTMAAILGLQAEAVEDVCKEASVKGVVEPANYNCPGQIVIGGEVDAIKFACELAKEKGAIKTVILPVSAPFHTSMLKPAADKLEEELKHIDLGKMKVPIISNVTSDYIKSEESIKNLLKVQVMSAVLFEDCIKRMISDGVDTFVEIGPGKALSGFVKKVDRKLTVVNIEDIKSFEKTMSVLRG